MTRDQRTGLSLLERLKNLHEDIGYFKAEQDLDANFDNLDQAENLLAQAGIELSAVYERLMRQY